MKSLFRGALSAGRKAAKQIMLRIFAVTTAGAVMMAWAFLLSACHGNTKDQRAGLQRNQADSVPKPEIDFEVNRRYDGKGNVTGFDSTYRSYYSNMTGDTAQMDSLMRSFDRYFRGDHTIFLRKKFDPLFFVDSTRYPDFFHNDFFLNRYRLSDRYFRDMMRDMDSMRSKFYEDHRKGERKSKTPGRI